MRVDPQTTLTAQRQLPTCVQCGVGPRETAPLHADPRGVHWHARCYHARVGRRWPHSFRRPVR
jgi:hypothetical protein